MNKETFKQLSIGLLRLTCAFVLAAIVGGVIFAGLEFVRNFQADTISSVSKSNIIAEQQLGGVLGLVQLWINWYSTTFFGYSRFGSGIGMIIASIWAASACASYKFWPRLVIAAVAGFLIGTRAAMFITSKPHLVLGAGLIASFIGIMRTFASLKPAKFKALPRLQFKHQP